MLKKFKLSNSRLLFLLIGILLAISVSGAWAAWSDLLNPAVNPGQQLTSSLWNTTRIRINEIIGEISSINSRIGNMTAKQNSCSWISPGPNVWDVVGYMDAYTAFCPVGQYMAGARFLNQATQVDDERVELWCCNLFN